MKRQFAPSAASPAFDKAILICIKSSEGEEKGQDLWGREGFLKDKGYVLASKGLSQSCTELEWEELSKDKKQTKAGRSTVCSWQHGLSKWQPV